MAFGQYLGFIGGVIGAIIGGVLGAIGTYGFGAPAGAAWGFTIGSAIGGIAGQVFWPEKADINTPPPPQPHETRLQFSSWGMPIPIQYGSGRLAGNIIYMSDIVETIDRSKHRQEGVRYYEMVKTYTSTFAIAFCEGRPVPEGIARIWMNNKVIADYRDPTLYPSGWVGYQELNIETSIARSLVYLNIYLGSETQTADPSIAALLTAAETPAYRGLCYIVFKDFPIGEFSGVPQIQIEIGRIGHGVWIERKPIDDTQYWWYAVGSNSTGSLLIAATRTATGQIYKSDDFGLSWAAVGPANQYWERVAVSSTGQYSIAASFNKRLYMSGDYGVSWTEVNPQGASDRTWGDVAISGDGAIVIASTRYYESGRVYKSTNYGASWSEIIPLGAVQRDWYRASISSNGLVIAATTTNNDGGGVMTCISVDSGVNWTTVNMVMSGGLACNADGSLIVACVLSGRVYKSIDYGASWQEMQPKGNVNGSWLDIDCDATGEHIVLVCSADRLYYSYDFGATWVGSNPDGGSALGWQQVAMDDSGLNSIACWGSGATSGRLFTYRG